ncbi:MAG: hypothetical protein M3461_16225, partial [Pseudomonadota bacterium]|nr:hypothetical protein [Pseudomonadota bacterium]
PRPRGAKITLPPVFRIEEYVTAIPEARFMVLGPDARVRVADMAAGAVIIPGHPEGLAALTVPLAAPPDHGRHSVPGMSGMGPWIPANPWRAYKDTRPMVATRTVGRHILTMGL